MATAKEIAAVCVALDKDWPEGTKSNEVATAAIKALDTIRGTMVRPVGPPLKEGLIFKSFLTSKVHYVIWIGEESPGGELYAWIVTDDSDYGWFSLALSPFWHFITPQEPGKGTVRNVKQFDADGEPILGDDGKQITERKEYPPVHLKVLSNEKWKAGDRIYVHQGNHYEVIAVHSRGALLRESETGIVLPESNHGLEKFYKREKGTDW